MKKFLKAILIFLAITLLIISILVQFEETLFPDSRISVPNPEQASLTAGIQFIISSTLTFLSFILLVIATLIYFFERKKIFLIVVIICLSAFILNGMVLVN